MHKEPVLPKPEDEEQWQQLLFILKRRKKSTLILITCDSSENRDALCKKLEKRLANYKHHLLDLSSHNVVSLKNKFKEELPREVQDSEIAEYIVHIYGLESSVFVSEEGQIQDSVMLPELNFERESIFRANPFITIIWADAFFFEKMQMKAPDLWDWITYKYKFEGKPESIELPAVIKTKQPSLLPKGRFPEREERIKDLNKRYKSLKIKSSKKERDVRERINILTLLGNEYAELNIYNKAIRSFQTALVLLKKIDSSHYLKMEILFRLAGAFLETRDFNSALENYHASLQLQLKYQTDANIGATYHQMGMVFQGQRKWGEAFLNYQAAIDWKTKTDKLVQLGSTYHQIGMVFQGQGKWNEALRNYQAAIDWNTKTDNLVQLGGSYHQIGMVFQEQGKWAEALRNYQTAIDWKMKTNNLIQLGATYHHIGMVFQGQRKWDDALRNYQTAIDWKTKTDNLLKLGDTYHQIGVLFQEQRKWDEALRNYQRAIDWNTKIDNLFELGGSYHQMGRVFEQMKAWNSAFISYLETLHADYEEQEKVIIDAIKKLLPQIPTHDAKDIFEKYFPSDPPERKDHCRALIWNQEQDTTE